MINSENTYHRNELAKVQLKTAVLLFTNDKDLSSVITLAAAASNILSQFVRNSEEDPFIDYACGVYEALKGETPKRRSYKNFIDNNFGINVHKHMSPSSSSTCILDLHKCAVNSLTMAIADYVTLNGRKDDFVISFLSWVGVHEDAVKLIEQYNNMPDKFNRPKQKRKKINLEKAKKNLLNRKKTTKVEYQRFQLAANQLETAIMLFLTDDDKISAITLAGAADVIFCELVNREGKKNFTDILAEEEPGSLNRTDIGKSINDLMHINALKHFDKEDLEFVTLNVEECALAAILKALTNYNMLDGKKDALIIAFLYWVRTNVDLNKYNLNDNEQE